MNRMGSFVPRYAISTGNQIDVGTADFLEHLVSDDGVRTFGCYIEGFRDLEGIRFALAAQEAVRSGKEVIVYKAGRTSAGKKAAGGHTAAIAGDWNIAREILSHSGCIFAESFEEWSDLLMLSSLLAGKPVGAGRIGAISNAGCETVGLADRTGTEKGLLELAQLNESTVLALRGVLEHAKLTELQEVRNPLDLTPMANDRAHAEALRAFHDDPNVDLLLHSCIPMTSMIKAIDPADPEGYARMLESLLPTFVKPLVCVIDAGTLYDPLAEALFKAGIPVFRSIDRAVTALSRWATRHRSYRPKGA
jgi:acetate---CoA ligase (ADP-forming)